MADADCKHWFSDSAFGRQQLVFVEKNLTKTFITFNPQQIEMGQIFSIRQARSEFFCHQGTSKSPRCSLFLFLTWYSTSNARKIFHVEGRSIAIRTQPGSVHITPSQKNNLRWSVKSVKSRQRFISLIYQAMRYWRFTFVQIVPNPTSSLKTRNLKRPPQQPWAIYSNNWSWNRLPKI